MTTTTAIITDAFRESNLIMEGQVPSTAQQTEALSRLSSMVAGVFGFDVGEQLQDWMVGTLGQDQFEVRGWSEIEWRNPIPNSRLLLNHSAAQTIYLPYAPEDGSRIQAIDLTGTLSTRPITLDGNGRLIEGARTLLLNTDNLNRTWIYNEHDAEWRVVSTIALDAEMPFPPEFDDYFIIRLAARLNPRYGRSLNDLSIARLNEVSEQLQARYRQKRPMPAPTAVRNLRGPLENFRERDWGGRGGRFGWLR